MIYIGTSGWSYPAFEEKFYGKKLSGIEQLKFYAEKFNTVEINYSFYHIPKQETFKKWHQATPEDFVFSIKLNKQFTHTAQLGLPIEVLSKLETFLFNAQELGKKFGVLLIQTPKSLKYNLPRLQKFLAAISEILKAMPYPPRLAFEFRSESWFNQKTYELLSSFGAAIVISQSSQYPEKHIVISGLIYIRFHGPEKLFNSGYSNQELKDWKEFIGRNPQAKEIYIYFNNTMQGQAINNAVYFQKVMGT